MNISSFDDLLTLARQQPTPQRLLFVFAGIELPADSTPEPVSYTHLDVYKRQDSQGGPAGGPGRGLI